MKHLSATIFLILLLAAVFLGYVFIASQISLFGSVIAKAKESEKQRMLREEILEGSSTFLADAALLQAELESFVVKEDEPLRIIEAIENAAKRENVSVSIGPVSALPGEWQHHEPIRVIFSARGSYANLSRFTASLESLPVVSRMESVSLEPSGNTGWFGTFTVDFIKEKTNTP